MVGFPEDGTLERTGDHMLGEGPVGHASTGDDDHHHALIASDRIEGTAVHNRAGERLGTVRRFLVDKASGQARYAEMGFGGFLGFGEDVHPLPWETLDYDPAQDGYVVDLTEDQLRAAPRYGHEERRPIDDVYDAKIRSYYGLMPPI